MNSEADRSPGVALRTGQVESTMVTCETREHQQETVLACDSVAVPTQIHGLVNERGQTPRVNP